MVEKYYHYNKENKMIKRVNSELNKDEISAYHDFIEYDLENKKFNAIKKMFLQVK